MQKTIKKNVIIVGTGIHLGRPARLTIKPAPTNHGIVFKRLDVDHNNTLIKANFKNILSGELCTTLVNEEGISVKTVEHLLAAFSGLGISNALIEIDNEEIPILDGSSLKFAQALIEAGICEQDESLNFCSVKKSIKVVNKNSWVKFEPADNLILTVCIDYPNTCIGKQSLSLLISKDTFQKELCDNRTFCLKNDIKDMRSRGFALGGSLDNAIVVDGYSVINPKGLKRKDEFVRHKMLDALGDLALSGLPLLGHYKAFCAGHKLNNQLLIKLFSNHSNYKISVPDNINSEKYVDHNFCSTSQNYRAVI